MTYIMPRRNARSGSSRRRSQTRRSRRSQVRRFRRASKKKVSFAEDVSKRTRGESLIHYIGEIWAQHCAIELYDTLWILVDQPPEGTELYEGVFEAENWVLVEYGETKDYYIPKSIPLAFFWYTCFLIVLHLGFTRMKRNGHVTTRIHASNRIENHMCIPTST